MTNVNPMHRPEVGGGVQTPRKTMQYLVNYCEIGLCLTPLANHSLTPPPTFRSPHDSLGK